MKNSILSLIHSCLQAAAVTALLAVAPMLSAATYNWTAGDVTEPRNWGLTANWDSAPTFNTNAVLNFNIDVAGNGATFLGSQRQIRELVFGSDLASSDDIFQVRTRTTIGGATAANLLLNNGGSGGNASITVAAGTVPRIILGQGNVGAIAFQTNTDLFHNVSGTLLQFDSNTTGAGVLNVYGVGTTSFTRNNSFAGLNIYGGSVVAWNSATALGGSNAVSLGETASANDASLFVGNGVTYGNNITVNSGSGLRRIGNTNVNAQTGLGAITGNPALSGTIDLSAGKDVTFDVTSYVATTTDRLSVNGLISGDGGIVKTGGGLLQLNGINTYTGNTTISAGELLLSENAALTFVIGANGVNNKLTGTGVAEIAGDFIFDLTSAGTTLHDSWIIAELAGITYSGTFSVDGFTAAGSGLWTRNIDGTEYQFSQSTGTLTVIPEPATYAMLGGLLALCVVMLRRRMR